MVYHGCYRFRRDLICGLSGEPYIEKKKMKYTLRVGIVTMLICCCAFTRAQSVNKTDADGSMSVKIGDSTFVIKQYFFVMLSDGPNRSQDSITAEKIQAAHLKNISRLAQMGKLLVAGPFGDDGKWKGIFIFNCKTKEEVEELVKTDPAVSAGRLNYELHPWWTGKNCVFK